MNVAVALRKNKKIEDNVTLSQAAQEKVRILLGGPSWVGKMVVQIGPGHVVLKSQGGKLNDDSIKCLVYLPPPPPGHVPGTPEIRV